MASSCKTEIKEPDKGSFDDKLLAKSQSKIDEESSSDVEQGTECPVCLQTCIHPVQLPCTHIFCFLCVKGVANQSKRCALCRQEIPVDFLNNPSLIRREDLFKVTEFEDGSQWFYEGRNGWWQYDERTSAELEEKFKKGIKAFEILIAGFLYVIDMDNMIQIRRNDPTRRRRIKRDLSSIPKKGVAGLKIVPSADSSQERDGADGGEGNDANNGVGTLSSVNNNNGRLQTLATPSTNPRPGDVVSGSASPRLSPRTPSNTPQSPEQGSPGEPVTPSGEELSSQMANLSVASSGRVQSHHTRRRPRISRPGRARLQTVSSSSSDTDWD